MDIWNNLFAAALYMLPTGINRLQELQILRRMDCGYGAHSVIRGLYKPGPCGLGTVAENINPTGLFGVRFDLATGHKILGIMKMLAGIQNSFHHNVLFVLLCTTLPIQVLFVNTEFQITPQPLEVQHEIGLHADNTQEKGKKCRQILSSLAADQQDACWQIVCQKTQEPV
jgi:hypothetical protein